MSMPDPSLELRARVLAAAGAYPIMSRAQGRRRRGALVAAGFALMVPISMCLGGPGLRGRPVGYAFALALSWLAIASATSWAGVSRGRSMLGRTRGWSMVTAVATPIALLGVSIALGMVWPQMLHEAPGRQQRVLWFVAPPHIVCLTATPLFAAGPLIAFALIRRCSDPVAPRLTGAALGTAAGAWAALAIELHCARGSIHHVLIGHVLPVVALALIGMTLGGRVVAVRATGG